MRRTPKRKRAEATVEHILETTESLIASEGVLDLSTNSIARAAGISIGSIYLYFPNKEAIIVALYRRALERIWAEIQAVSVDLGPKPSLEAVMDAAKLRIGPTDRREFSHLDTSLGGVAIPEVIEARRNHGMRVASWLADLLETMGSQWQRTKLERLATMVFATHATAIWEAAAILGDFGNDIEEWRDHAIESLIKLALTDEFPDGK